MQNSIIVKVVQINFIDPSPPELKWVQKSGLVYSGVRDPFPSLRNPKTRI